MKKITNYSEEIIAYIVSCAVALIFGFNSPSHPWIGSEPYTDSGVFKTIALMMEHGYMPYRDSFDHKGPVLYILNWIGNRISQYSGIWVIEIIVLSVTFYFLYKISRLKCSIIASLIVSFTALSLLFEYYQGGNLTEEYAMPCIAISIFIFLDYLLNNKVSKIRLVVSGLCCGIVLLLRPNMISIWVVYCFLISLILVYKRAIKEWIGFIIYFLIGMAIIVIPIVIWLGINEDLYYCFHDYILFNIKYSSAEGGIALLSSKWSSFFIFFNTTVYIVAFACIVFHIKEAKLINISYAIYLIMTIVFMVMSGMSYGHYGMILIPAVIYPLSLVFSDIEKIKEDNQRKVLILLVSLYSLSMIITPNWINTIEGVVATYEAKDDNHCSDSTNNIVNLIVNKTEEEDKISVYGNWNIIYVLSNRVHATRYSYQFPIGQVMPEIMDEYMKDLQEELPKILVIMSGKFDDNIHGFLDKNNYQLLYPSNVEDPYNADSALLYFRQ